MDLPVFTIFFKEHKLKKGHNFTIFRQKKAMLLA